jgi:hypothetical protein
MGNYVWKCPLNNKGKGMKKIAFGTI